MDLTFCKQVKDEQIYTGELNLNKMFEHILNLNLFVYCCCRLYFYFHSEGRFILIDTYNEWHVISCFFSKKIQRNILPKHICELMSRLRNTIDIQCCLEDFDNEFTYINTRNGVFNYLTKEVFPKDKKYKFTYQLKAAYIENSTMDDAPYFKKFCETSLGGDKEKIILLLQSIGYLLSPLSNAKKCFIFLGAPNSGKSQLLHLIECILGKEFISNLQLEKLGARFASAQLSTKRLNICGELSSRPLRDIETFKLVVGGDTLTGEFKNKDMFQFDNRCKLLFSGNVLPPIHDEDVTTAFIDRLVILRFPYSIPQEERDYELCNKLTKEMDIIFSLAIDTLPALIEKNYEFVKPADSLKLMNDYSFQQTNIDTFVDEWCVMGDKLKVHSLKLYEAYKDFCNENLIKPISQNLFSQKIGSLYGVENSRFRLNGSKSMRGFIGISLKFNTEQDSDLYSDTDF